MFFACMYCNQPCRSHQAKLCRCTPSTSPLFDIKLLKKRCHLTAIGSYKKHMHEFDLEAMMQDPMVKIHVDSAEACLAEAGELQFLDKEDSRIAELMNSATVSEEGQTVYKVGGSIWVGS